MNSPRQKLTMDDSLFGYFRLSGECQWYSVLLVSLLTTIWPEVNADETLTSFEAFDEPWKEYVFSSHRIR